MLTVNWGTQRRRERRSRIDSGATATSSPAHGNDSFPVLSRSPADAYRVISAIGVGGVGRLAMGIADPRGESPSLRILIDLIEEYARHAGHADLIRAPVDGLTGADPPG